MSNTLVTPFQDHTTPCRENTVRYAVSTKNCLVFAPTFYYVLLLTHSLPSCGADGGYTIKALVSFSCNPNGFLCCISGICVLCFHM